jgi:hypothetical protein
LKIVEAAGSEAVAVVETSEDTAVPTGSRMTVELKHPGIVITSASGQQLRWCDPERRASAVLDHNVTPAAPQATSGYRRPRRDAH